MSGKAIALQEPRFLYLKKEGGLCQIKQFSLNKNIANLTEGQKQ